MINAHDFDRTRVVGTIATTAFTVVVRCVGVQTGAAVIGIAFARFRFFFGFFARPSFFAYPRLGSPLPCPAPRFFVPFLGHDPPQPSPFCFSVRFPRCPLPRFSLGTLGIGV